MRLGAVLSACAALAMSFPVAAAQPATNSFDLDRDITCLALFVLVADEAPDETMREQATLGAFYFLGRVDGALPEEEFETRLVDTVMNMSPADRQRAAGRCGQLMINRGQSLIQLGRRLEQRATGGRNGASDGT